MALAARERRKMLLEWTEEEEEEEYTTRKPALFPENRVSARGYFPTHERVFHQNDKVKLLGFHSGKTGTLVKLYKTGFWRVVLDGTGEIVTCNPGNLRKDEASAAKMYTRVQMNRTPVELDALPAVREYRRRKKMNKDRSAIKDRWTRRLYQKMAEGQDGAQLMAEIEKTEVDNPEARRRKAHEDSAQSKIAREKNAQKKAEEDRVAERYGK